MSEKLAHERSSIPVVARCNWAFDQDEEKRLSEIAGRLMRDEPAFISSKDFGSLIHQGVNDCPALIIGDQREINLYLHGPSSQRDYRMALLAQSGDSVIISRRDEAFEHYLAKYLLIDGINFIEARDQDPLATVPVSVRCRTDQQLRSLINDVADKAGGLLILPYLTTGNIWRIAQEVAKDTGMTVKVCGPAPQISARANNKIWFSDCVRQILGTQAVPPTFIAYGPAAAAAHIARLSKRSKRVIVKIPDSAGSFGNVAFDSDRITAMPLSQIRRSLLFLLHGRGWHDHYPILVGIWECDVVSSPSVQLWIPSAEEGPPIVEGIFEQVVQNVAGTFVGAKLADLPPPIKARLVSEASKISFVFQKLGYFGRCSLDAIVSKQPEEGQSLHWIECNGRWGGVSIPLTVANRLNNGQPAQGLVIVQQSNLQMRVQSTGQVVEALDDLLYKQGSSTSGVVLMSPTGDSHGTRMDFIAIGENQKIAEELAGVVFSKLQR